MPEALPAANGSWERDIGSSRILFGAGSLARVGEVAAALGARRLLLVTDPGVRRAGHVERAVAALERSKIGFAVTEAVAENPSARDVEKVARAAREGGVDGFVAVGGGSAMDCAKGANFLVTNGGSIEDYWGTGKAERPMLPSIGAPTTAGTGSEAQSYALILQEGTGRKMACGDAKAMFRAVILDPMLPATAPREVIATTGIDAISHAVESFVTRRRNEASQLFAREAWRLLEGNLDRVLDAPDDLEAQGRMLLGAYFAGAAIERSMLGAAHACANPLTARYPIAHGVAVALMLPPVMRFNAVEVGALYAELHDEAATPAAAGLLEERIRDLRSSAGLPETLGEVGVPRESLGELAGEASEQWTAGHNPRKVTSKELLEIYEAAY